MTSTEALAANITEDIASSIPEATDAELRARTAATDRAMTALRTFMGPAEMDIVEHHIRNEALDGLIIEKLGETYTAEIASNAACAALLGELAQAGITAEDYATLTGRWFSAFEGK